MDIKGVTILAFYLPQYHPTKHNDQWWGKGFTEWTNVAKARKLFINHYQPRIPSELGFYDLRLPEIREEQASLAKAAGISGFCYYHYWFSQNHEELEMPFKEVVKLGTPDFPFCLCWANESWYSKFWNKDGSFEKTLLAEQKYLGTEDNKAHFYSLLSAFKDSRYIRIDGKLLFMIYQPMSFANFSEFKHQWNRLAKENGLPGFYFIAQTLNVNNIDAIFKLGFDGINHCHRLDNIYQNKPFIYKILKLIKKVTHIPFVISYKSAIRNVVAPEDFDNNIFPTIMPNWDHTPRSSDGGSVLHNSTPLLFKDHARDVLRTTLNKEHKIIFLKSWNEWGEGNYMEPDLKYGRGYINALNDVIQEFK